jgi:hypothetical protein
MLNHTRIAVVGTLVVIASLAAFIGYRMLVRPMMNGWPVTVDAAATEVIKNLNEEQRSKLASAKREDLFGYHFGLGLYIRNQFGLWQGNGALLWSACGDCQPDDASMVIVERTWTKLRSKPR